MTIALSANTPRVSYTVSQGATQTSFAVPFVFFTGSTDLNVFVDNVARTFDASTSNTSLFTVSGGNGSTGTVTTSVTGATGGSTVVITRAIPLSRTTDFPSSGAFEISKLNTELDTVTAIQSDFNDSASRAIRLQDSDSAVSMELPLLASRKGTVLGFNATTGAAEAGPTITAVQSLSDVTASINLLGTSAVVEDMGLLATSANVTAMGLLGTSSNVTAMGLLGNSTVIADMALLGTSDVVADMALLATTDVIADMNTLATSDIISDLNTLATSDIVTDMNLLATSDNVTAMGVLGTSANVTNMATLGASGVVGNIATVAGVSSNVTTVAGISSNVTTVAGISSNVTTVAGVASNVTTVANNISGVNSFAERYRVQSGVPSSDNDVGDLVFDTAANTLKVFGSSGFQNAGSSVNGTSERFTYNITGTPTTLTGASGTGFAEANSNTLAYDAGFIDVYLNGVKMVNGTDVTVTSGTSVVFASALSNGDVVDIVTFGTFQVANIVSTGALNSGSITSGFGNIDNGTSTLTTGNSDINGTLNVQGETTLQTHLNMGDSDKIKLGDSGDLEIYHDGSNSFVDDTGTGNLFLRGESQVIIGNMTGEQAAVFNDDGAVTLNHDNSAKFATTSSGIDVTGGITADGEIDVASSSSLSTISATATGSANLVMGTNFTGSASQGMANQCGFINMRQSFPIVFGTAETERMRIHSGGVTSFATTNTNPAENNVAGTSILTTGAISASADGNFGIQINRKSSFGGVIHLRKDGSGGGFLAIFEDSSAGRLLLGNDNTCLLFNDSAKQIIPFNSVGSKQDNVIDLGNASGRFGDLFAANSSINTSDRNEKQDIEELSEAEKRVAIVAKGLMRKFKWKDAVTKKGDKARTHFGIIAQDLQDAFTAEGLDATKYGMFCSDTFWDNDEVYIDDDGKEHKIVKSYYTEKEAPEGSTKRTRLAVRYSELLAFIISAI